MKVRKFAFFTNPEKAFATIGLVFGILFLLITPPFQIPDETAHFFRSYQVSEGQIIAERQENQAGGLLPKSLVDTWQKVSSDIPFNPEIKQKPEAIFSLLNLPLESNNKIFAHFPNTSLYSPIPYLPQAAGMTLGKIFGLSPIILLYLGRISNLLVWVLLGYLSIKITPIFKWVFFLLALTPMSLFQAASLSADAVTNGLSILLITIFLNYAFVKTQKLSSIHVFIIFLISICLSLAKQVYFPLVFLFLLIPVRKFGTKIRYFITFALLVLLCLVAILVWSLCTKEVYIPLYPYVSSGKQLLFILKNPISYFIVILNTLLLSGADSINQFIGKLGWLDTQLPTLLINSYAIALLFVSLVSNRKDIVISYKQKLIIFLTLLLDGIIVVTVVYLTVMAVGVNIIEGIQGRYFIPIAPLFFLLLYNQKLHLDLQKFGVVLVCYSLFSETLTVSVLLHRYYLG